MANLIRGLSENGGVVFCGVDSTEIVRKAEKLHTTSATCSAALGRLLTGATLMGSMLKDDRDRITLSVTSPDNGTAAEDVPGDYAAQPFEIGFNSRYLMDILGQVEGDLVEVHLADASAPTLIRESQSSPALYVLMPMRV